MDATLKAQLATQIIASHPRIGFNIADPSIVGAAVDAVEALEDEFEKREAAQAAAAKSKKDEKPVKPDPDKQPKP
jgi:hypothetical protein